ncbi:HET-domain-containing protein [Aaosphaeria arxii CBS 175.79]|uniref:HET-domain-containing protein n=1 Tax=Aaosphaeria arxii CBS 175.79 TaxID=1450172 RepID=A0A6A5XFA8_9PLEO|nr:HET-domain-containing protein [Aaosphaeria arxii CBS 175.79]KAF2011549.1 HET-domain-containing protein [Aaosphaeria arxii CBS 175.79]
MAVTIALGYQYLWVDRYCISTDSAQKHQQISEMDLVYCSAHATIIAESAQIPSDGLPGVSTRCRQRQPQITLDKGVLRHTLPHGGAVIGNSKWASRAWCYQEYCLSRRRLFFTQSQVIFECAKTQAHETMSTSQAYFLAEEARPWKSFFPACYFATEHSASTRHVWDSIYNYTGRAMSYESDALNAMLGLFKVFQSSPVPIYHFWGVPYRPWANRSDLIENPISSLCWYILGSWKRRRTFPSWSWLGWSGSVLSEFHDKQDTETDHDLRIGAETRDGNEVQGWPPELCTKNRLAPYLLLEGKTSQLKCSRQDEHRLWYLRAVDGGEWLVLSDEIGFYAGGNPMSPHCVLEGEISDGEKGHHDSLTAVLLGTDSGLIYLLVLERNRTLDNEKRIGCERIGYIKIHRFDVMAKIQWENRRLRVG